MKKTYVFLPYLIIIVFGLIGLKALFHPGFYTSLDGWHNIARLYHYHTSLLEGQIPPRWSGYLANGYGYPLFTFSYHMPWIIAEPFLRLGFDIFTTIKFVFVLGFVFSGIFMFLFMRNIFGVIPSLTASVVYMWTPYRFAKILVGASMGEATVFLFLPLLFWGIWESQRNKSYSAVIIGAVGFAGVILSHLMIIPLISFLIFFISIIVLKQSSDKKATLGRLFLLFLLGVGLASFYLLPAIAYQGQIMAGIQKGGFASLYENHFVTLKQLFYSKWGYGPIISRASDGELSFQVGLAQWLAFILTVVYVMTYRSISSVGKKLSFALMLIFSFMSAVFLTTDYSLSLWKFISAFITLDYPWRYLTLTTFIGAILCGFVVSIFNRYQLVIFILFLLVAIYTNRNHLKVNQYTDYPLSLYIDSEITTNTFAEYLPKYTRLDINKKPKSIIDNDKNILIENLGKKSGEMKFTITLSQPQIIKINYLYFPGQTVYVDGVKKPFSYEADGRIELYLNSGNHKIRVVFEQTQVMKLGNILTVISAAVILFVWKKTFKRERNVK